MSSPYSPSGSGGNPDATTRLPAVDERTGSDPDAGRSPEGSDGVSAGSSAAPGPSAGHSATEPPSSQVVAGPGGTSAETESPRSGPDDTEREVPVTEQTGDWSRSSPEGEAAPSERSEAATGQAPAARRPRRARLVLRRIDPWSVARMTLVISLALLVVFLVAVGVLYLVLDLLGVFETVNDAVSDLTSSEDGGSGGLEIVFSAGRILGASALLGALYVLLATALATLGALLYNVCADLAGGIEVTLTES